MPYIRERDFTRIREDVETIKELAGKGEYLSIPDIAARALKVLDKYIPDLEEENEKKR